ncbi:MAG: amidinotransferase [Proteobacteria bacterium]|nr:amidinotransferase [Pseudomonadota bacterium]NDC24637.1 amidinotransferase [Pseudomonadota bacterium]NDD04821.1 amidinotransferase [Pseudomonadota bacterium]NDG26737.1 amidinotransferase [Pseudomonadota bacterium]
MIIENSLSALSFLRDRRSVPSLPSFDSILMASPDFFKVAYAINPYMTDESGNLKQVDSTKAREQWEGLRRTFIELGLKVEAIPGVENLPDIVFTANQTFPFWNANSHRYEILLSHMRSKERSPEVSFFKRWFEERGITVHELNYSGAFEGNGDAIFSPAHGVVFGGYGPRTDKEVYQELSDRFHLPIVRLELRSKDFYHLDTCFSILSKEVAAVQPEAFTKEGLLTLQNVFNQIIEIPYQENIEFFCGNCFCPDGQNVILQKGSETFEKQLVRLGFRPWAVDTSEFMKSGGSVFCLKLFYRG